ncbi:thiamine/thiamine pyrophosphate ABC transporter permease [Vibrio sp.]|nr:thiamine/thiamine pyrophosphate ABC transporter permease [Vibrio sp.]
MISTDKVGWGAAILVVAFVALAISTLLSHFSWASLTELWTDAYLRHVTYFSFYQAFISTLLSVVPAVPIAVTLYRRRFPGRAILIRLCSVTLVMPVLIGVFGIMAIYGNNGILKQWLSGVGIVDAFSLYGLSGILLAHVFFNLPYASRLILQILETIPMEQNQLASHLGFSRWQRFRWIEWPRIKQSLLPVSGLVFMLCFTSFATVMTLGGGPKSTTIELAIYQAIKFDFDLTTGAILAIAQMLFCSGFYFLFQRNTKSLSVDMETPARVAPILRTSALANVLDTLNVLILAWVVLPPIAAVIFSGLNANVLKVFSEVQFWSALKLSLFIALCSGMFATVIGYLIVLTSRQLKFTGHFKQATGVELLGSLVLITPSLVISTGLFLLLRRFSDIYSFSMFIVILVNGLMALPFVIKVLSQPMYLIEKQYHFLCHSLGIKGWNRFALIDFKAIKTPIVYAFSLSFLLSMGDLTAISMFGSQDFQTLPMYLFRLLGSYQMESASVVALCMMVLSVLFFVFFERISQFSSKG